MILIYFILVKLRHVCLLMVLSSFDIITNSRYETTRPKNSMSKQVAFICDEYDQR